WGEVRLGVDGRAEAGQEAGGPVEVIQTDHLHGAVHVAVRDADHRRRHAVAGHLDRVGVRPRGPRRPSQLYCDLAPSRLLAQQVMDARVDVRATEQHRPLADLDVAKLLLLAPWRVGRVADVDGDADLRMDAVTAGGGAAQADLLLDRRNT